MTAFVRGASSASSLGGAEGEVNDVIWAPLSDEVPDLAVVAGRDGVAWRERERRQLDAVADIIGLRWAELGRSRN